MILIRVFYDDGVTFFDHVIPATFLPYLLVILCEIGVRYDVRPDPCDDK